MKAKKDPLKCSGENAWHLEIASCFRFGFLDVSRQKKVRDFEEKKRVPQNLKYPKRG